jgi:hypothetical protein
MEYGHADPVGEPGPIGPVGIVAHEPELVDETIETNPLPTTVKGVVYGCSKLNVRAAASLFAEIVCVMDVKSEVMIDVNKSDNEWFYVCTASGIEGYCLRKFVEAHL